MKVRAAHLRRPLAALFAASAAAFALSVVEPGPAPAVRVLTAARDLPGGTRLRPADVRRTLLPPGSVPAGTLRSGAVGRVLAGPMRRGEPLTDARFVGGGLLHGRHGPGAVATPVRIADADAVRLVRAGDRIDVLAAETPPDGTDGAGETAPAGACEPAVRPAGVRQAAAHLGAERASPPCGPGYAPAAQGAAARVVVSSVPVVAVPRRAAGSGDEGSLLVLATDRAQAAALAGAGRNLSITITGHW